LPSRRIIILILLSLTLGVLGYVNHQRATTHLRLFQTYFSAIPAGGYGTQRGLKAKKMEDEQPLLRQGIRYHQQGKYGHALMALRNYLEGGTVSGVPPAELLAATAAAAIGEYQTGVYFLDQMPRDQADQRHQYGWYRGLFALREGNLSLAEHHLVQVARDAGPYQMKAEQLLTKLEKAP
jgi:hypothetical protein